MNLLENSAWTIREFIEITKRFFDWEKCKDMWVLRKGRFGLLHTILGSNLTKNSVP